MVRTVAILSFAESLLTATRYDFVPAGKSNFRQFRIGGYFHLLREHDHLAVDILDWEYFQGRSRI